MDTKVAEFLAQGPSHPTGRSHRAAAKGYNISSFRNESLLPQQVLLYYENTLVNPCLQKKIGKNQQK